MTYFHVGENNFHTRTYITKMHLWHARESKQAHRTSPESKTLIDQEHDEDAHHAVLQESLQRLKLWVTALVVLLGLVVLALTLVIANASSLHTSKPESQSPVPPSKSGHVHPQLRTKTSEQSHQPEPPSSLTPSTPAAHPPHETKPGPPSSHQATASSSSPTPPPKAFTSSPWANPLPTAKSTISRSSTNCTVWRTSARTFSRCKLPWIARTGTRFMIFCLNRRRGMCGIVLIIFGRR